MAERRDLIDAYVEVYEEDADVLRAYDDYVKATADEYAPEGYESWLEDHVEGLINSHDPERRLAIYLQWNGIIGYTSSIFAIATGDY